MKGTPGEIAYQEGRLAALRGQSLAEANPYKDSSLADVFEDGHRGEAIPHLSAPAQPKPHRVFPPEQVLTSEDFDVYTVNGLGHNRQWVAALGGNIIYRLPAGLVRGTVDFSEYEAACEFFDLILRHTAHGRQQGITIGRARMRAGMRDLLGFAEVKV